MKKVLMVLLLIFVFMMPQVSAERLLDIGAERFYHRWVDYNKLHGIFWSSELFGASNNRSYLFSVRYKENDADILISIDQYGYVESILTESSLKHHPASMALLFILIDESIGIDTDESDYLHDNMTEIVENGLYVSKVWVNSLNKTIALYTPVYATEDNKIYFLYKSYK